jgi:antitoxin PrlF
MARGGAMADASAKVEYVGKRTKTGNSMGFRFEGALFKSHPEFSGTVRARVIAPGRLLVVADPVEERVDEAEEDPVLQSFLAFLARDMETNPDSIRPLNEAMMAEVAELIKDVSVDPDEDLATDGLLEW